MSDNTRPPLLEAQDITVRFGGLVAVDAVSARFQAGELVGIIGPNGAGKTTFFNAISGVTEPTSGRLLVQGRNLTGRGPHRFAANGLARTFQTPRVFPDMPVQSNIEFGLKFAGKRPRKYVFWGDEKDVPWALRDAAGILRLIGLSDQAALPAGAITPSQQRLLEIGMALATRPRLLLLDEVLAGLNPQEVAEMIPVVRAIVDDGVTVLMIEHVMQAVMNLAAHVWVLAQGRLIASGTPSQVTHDATVIEAYLGHGTAARLRGAHA